MKLFNLTLHKQPVLALMARDGQLGDFTEVEEAPRFKPVADPADYEELKAAVRVALKEIPEGASVLVGGLGQLQALVTDLGLYQAYFANYDPVAKEMKGVVRHVTWSRAERYEIENGS